MPKFISDPVTMPDEVGKSIDVAGDELDFYELPWVTVPQPALNKSPGTVIAQSWTAGTDVSPGTLITLTIASDGSYWGTKVIRRLGA